MKLTNQSLDVVPRCCVKGQKSTDGTAKKCLFTFSRVLNEYLTYHKIPLKAVRTKHFFIIITKYRLLNNKIEN